MNPFKKCRTLALVVCWALAARGFVLLPSGALQPPRASTWSGPSRIRLVDPRLFAGFGKAAKAKKAPKFNGKVSMERHMKSFMKLRAGDWSNVADVYVKGENSEKFYFVGKATGGETCAPEVSVSVQKRIILEHSKLLQSELRLSKTLQVCLVFQHSVPLLGSEIGTVHCFPSHGTLVSRRRNFGSSGRRLPTLRSLWRSTNSRSPKLKRAKMRG